MISYLYQMDYDDMLPGKTATSSIEESLVEDISHIEGSTAHAGPLVAESVSYHGNFGLVEPTEPAIPDYISESEPESEAAYEVGYNFYCEPKDHVEKPKANEKITELEVPCR